jgi:hypothetical protein
MSQATPQMRDFAEHLIVHETRGNKSSGARTRAAFPVIEKLRPKLATLIGDAGFRALLSRTLARAQAEVPSLRAVQVEADGTLRGVAEFEAEADPREIAEGRVAVLAQLLGMLVAFIGQDLTLRLTREVWPKFSFKEMDSGRRQR